MNTKNIEFEIAVRKLDNIVEKIYNNENKLTDKEENLDSINLVSMLIIELGLKFSSNYIIFNEILNYAIKFYSENKDRYRKKINECISIKNKNIKYVQLFNKIANQLEYLK